MLRGEFTITQLTEHWLSRNLTVKFEADTLYRCYTIIDKDYRGQGIFCNFTQFLLDYYKKDPYINYVVFITRASNAPNISFAMRHNAKLIGIIEVKSVLGKIMRKELFLDHKYRKWS
jgi:ribosomal protein S18 acetylase RimI-like enzyme